MQWLQVVGAATTCVRVRVTEVERLAFGRAISQALTALLAVCQMGTDRAESVPLFWQRAIVFFQERGFCWCDLFRRGASAIDTWPRFGRYESELGAGLRRLLS